MSTYTKTFGKIYYPISYTPAFPIGDANDHTFMAIVSSKKTSIDYNFQMTLNGSNWVDLGSDIQKTVNGNYLHSFSGVHAMAIRGAYKAEVGGVKATITVGTVVFAAVNIGADMNSYTIETAVGVDAGSEVVTISGFDILVTGNAASTIGQIQTAVAANSEVAALITANSLTTFAAGAQANLASGDGAQLDILYKGGE